MGTTTESVDREQAITAASNQLSEFESSLESMEGVDGVKQLDDTHTRWAASIAFMSSHRFRGVADTTALLLTIVCALMMAMPAARADVTNVPVARAVDPTPTPTLGSTNSPNPLPEGVQDGDPSDFDGMGWLLPVLLVLILGVAVAIATVLISRRRNRRHQPTDGMHHREDHL